MWIKVVPLGVLFSKLSTIIFSVLNFVLLTTSSSTTSLNFYKPTVFNLSTSKASTFVLELSKLVNLLISSLWTPAFKAIKSFLASKSDVSMPVAYSNYFLVA